MNLLTEVVEREQFRKRADPGCEQSIPAIPYNVYGLILDIDNEKQIPS